MPEITLYDLLTEKYLNHYAGSGGFGRGTQYFFQGRVQIRYAYDHQAQCVVRGNRHYTVNFLLVDGELSTLCTCPHARRGWFCKHMVAAGLAVREYLEEHSATLWKTDLESVIKTVSQRASRGSENPYWLFLSLQFDGQWHLKPYRLWIHRVPDGILPSPEALRPLEVEELVHHNYWLVKHIKPVARNSRLNPDACLNCPPDEIYFAQLLLEQNRQLSAHNTFFYQPLAYPMAPNLSLLAGKRLPIFLGDLSNPVHRSLQFAGQLAEVSLQLQEGEAGLRLTPVLQIGDQLMDFDFDQLIPLTDQDQAWYLHERLIFRVDTSLTPDAVASLLDRGELLVPPESKDEFLENYFLPLVAHLPIRGEQIEWQDVRAEPVPRLYLADEDGELQAHLRFGYAEYEVLYEKELPEISVRRQGESWTLVRVHRDSKAEQAFWQQVSSPHHGLKRSRGDSEAHIFLLRKRVHPIDFLMRHIPRLVEAGFEIYGEEKLKSARVNRNRPTLSLNVATGIDWFDLQAVVTFGDVEASLKEVRRALRRKERYVKLADGTIGEIPEEWIQRYRHLFGLGEQTDEGVRLSNHHLTLIDQLLEEADRAQADPEFTQRKKRLLNFEGIEPRELPRGFGGELRPYQKAGYDWMHFLHEYEFGGCLADDMGLGKTVQALAFLLSLKESGHAQAPTLLVLPRSLLINWQREASRFTPDLRLYIHHGNQRWAETEISHFVDYDLILTTYGTMLRDVEKLRELNFHYVILDESQAIKNPLAKTSKAARLLRSDHRLVLTGTPVENSTFELWSQFAFLNPGLLGNLEYFKKEFGAPIEKQGDEPTAQFLRKMVYPFILRRTKEQVAPELPPRMERIVYTDMEPAQRKFYNKTRDYYRAMLLGVIEEQGVDNARMKVLEGLLRLRQISNHPKLVKENFRGDSAKFLLLMDTLKTLREEGHKALVFSQFVQMLKLVRAELDAGGIPYVYLDGRTRKRQERVDTFQSDPGIPFFLISLKAGGVGLNLTAADYVIHIDPWWNPAVEMQASDRTHRIGQDKPVFVYKLITRDSVEEKILKLQEKKRSLVKQLISTESSFFKGLTVEDIQVLFS